MKCSLQVHKNLNEMVYERRTAEKKGISERFPRRVRAIKCFFIRNDAVPRMRASNKIKQIKIQIAIHTRIDRRAKFRDCSNGAPSPEAPPA